MSDRVSAVPAPRSRLLFLDALRGIAALWVVIAHYTANLTTNHAALWGPENWLPVIADDPLDLGKTAVVLFFLISGYIIPNSLGPRRDRIGRFCITRFFRLYPLYWFALLLAIGWGLLGEGPQFSPATMLVNFTMIQGYLGHTDVVGAAWTLEIELMFYAMCLVMAVLGLISSTRWCALASVGFLGFAVLLAMVRFWLEKKLPVALPLALCLMFFGTVWRQAKLDRNPQAQRIAPWLLVLIAVTIVPICLLAYNHDYGYQEHWDRYVLSYAVGIVTFVVGTTRVKISWRPFVWLGQISYSLYLLHILVLELVNRLGFVPGALSLDPLVYMVTVMALAILVAWAANSWIEDPFIRIGHRLGRRDRGIKTVVPAVPDARPAA